MPSLLGRVPFGRVSNDPRMIFSQLMYLLSLFFMLLGCSIVLLEGWEAFSAIGDVRPTARNKKAAASTARARSFVGAADVSGGEDNETNIRFSNVKKEERTFDAQVQHVKQAVGPNANAAGNKYAKSAGEVRAELEESEAHKYGTYTPTSSLDRDYIKILHANFYVSFHSFFVPTAIGESTSALSADAKFILAHIMTAVLLCYPAALCVERRKFALDFIFSLYAVYVVLTVIVTRTIFQPFTFWMGAAVSLVISFIGTTQIAYRREMAEVLVSGEDGTSSSAPTHNTISGASTNTTSLQGGNTVPIVVSTIGDAPK